MGGIQNKLNLRRITGYIFLITATIGFLFGVVGLFEIWHIQPEFTQTVNDNLAIFDQALNTTQDGLTVVGKMVKTTMTDVTSLELTTKALAQTAHDATPMLDSLSKLTSKDLPGTISAAQTSLASAQNSALLIDNVLTTLTSIPLLPLAPYKPAVPLHTALAQVSDSLNTLKPALAAINTSLADGKANMGMVESQLKKISETTLEISGALGSAQTVVDQYQLVTAQLKTQVEAAQLKAPTWISTIAWILTFLFVWFLIAQLGLGMQGLEMLKIPLWDEK